MFNRKNEEIRAILLSKMGKGTEVITGGIFTPGLAERIKSRIHNATITATMILMLLGPVVPKTIASSPDTKSQLEYVETDGVYLEASNVRDLIAEIDKLFRQDKPDWILLKKKINELFIIGEKLGDIELMEKSTEYMRQCTLFFALDFIGEGKFTQSFCILDEYMDMARLKHNKSWIEDGEYAIKLIKDMIGKEQSSTGSLSVVAAIDGGISYEIKSYIYFDTTNTFYVVKMSYVSTLYEEVTKELSISEAKNFLKMNYELRKNLSDDEIIIEQSKDGIRSVITAKVLVDLK